MIDIVFSGLSIILVGDIAQLPPLLDKPLYCPVPEDTVAMMGFFAFRKIDHVMKLEQNLRASLASNQQEFRKLLLRFRNGESTISDWKLLNTRSLKNFSLKQMSNFKTRLSHTNEAVSSSNYDILLENGTTIITVKVNQNIKKASKMSPEEFGGLEPVLCLNVGARVMLIRNLCFKKGVCNSAMGIFKTIIYNERSVSPSVISSCINRIQEILGTYHQWMCFNYSNCFKRYYIKKSGKTSITLKVMLGEDFALVPSKEFLDIQATIECGFTLKRVHDMIRTYSQMHRTDKYSQHSSIIWPV